MAEELDDEALALLYPWYLYGYVEIVKVLGGRGIISLAYRLAAETDELIRTTNFVTAGSLVWAIKIYRAVEVKMLAGIPQMP